jgi:RNA polymerase sigma-70 factor, ECF subfamily
LTKELKDDEIIREFQKGNTLVFDELVIKYQCRIARVVTRFVHDPSEALDITQETFIKAYKALDRFQFNSSFYTWIYRIAVNTAKNHLIANGRKLPDLDYDVRDLDNISKQDISEYSSPEKMLICEEINSIFNHEVEKLPIELRTVIQLRDVDGMTYDQIANVMGCPIGTVRSRIYRAREVIGSKFDPLYR